MANEFKVKKGLIVDGTNTVLDIQGTQGQLFSVTDSLTGDLFSVSDISGVPILNVNSSGAVDIDGALTINGGDVKIVKQNDAPILTLLHDGTNTVANDLLFRMQFQSDYDGTHENWGKIELDTNNSAVRTNMDFYVKSASGAEQLALRLEGQPSAVPNATFAGDVSIPVAKRLYFGGGSHTYIVEDVDDRLRFVCGGDEHIRFTDGGNGDRTDFYRPTYFALAATFAGTIGSGAITSTGKVTGTELEGTSLDINGDADVTGTIFGTAGTNATFLAPSGGTSKFHQFESYWNTNAAGSTSTYRFDVGTWRMWSGISSGAVFTMTSAGNAGFSGTIGSGAITSTGKITGVNASFDSTTEFSLTSKAGDTIMVGDDTAGSSAVGEVGGSIGFSGPQTGTQRQAAIAALRTGSDHDHIGLAFYTHPGTSNDETIVKQLTINHVGAATFAGNINVGDGSTDTDSKFYHSDGAYVGVRGYGLYMSRVNSYIRPTADGTQTLWMGTSGATWNYVSIDANIFRVQKDGSTLFNVSSSDATFAGTVTANGVTLTGTQSSVSGNAGSVTNGVYTNTTQTISGTKTFSGSSNQHNGHIFYNSYDAAGNHYPHFKDGSSNSGTTINWRQYYGSSQKTHTWTSDASGNMLFTYQGGITAAGALTGTSLDINGAADISGTLNAAAISMDGRLSIVGDGSADGGLFFQESGSQEHRIFAAENNQYNVIGSSTPIWRWGQSDGNGDLTGTAKMTLNNGALTVTNDVVAFSDRKLKENIKTLDGKKVLDMRGVSFTRKDTGEESSGVIAQEIQKVAPELVHDTEGTLGVAYGNLVGYLIEAVKDQQKQIDELKAMINGNS